MQLIYLTIGANLPGTTSSFLRGVLLEAPGADAAIQMHDIGVTSLHQLVAALEASALNAEGQILIVKCAPPALLACLQPPPAVAVHDDLLRLLGQSLRCCLRKLLVALGCLHGKGSGHHKLLNAVESLGALDGHEERHVDGARDALRREVVRCSDVNHHCPTLQEFLRLLGVHALQAGVGQSLPHDRPDHIVAAGFSLHHGHIVPYLSPYPLVCLPPLQRAVPSESHLRLGSIRRWLRLRGCVLFR
mmetsp:Transcript_16381/g.49102  ORF Transcript_16381/g.49102 Transcript_16381/m.49102 type:complete len:246 (+) Transcript_16381:224-961(+)